MKTSLTNIIGQFKKSIIQEINPIYFKKFLIKTFKNQDSNVSLVFENSREPERYITAIYRFLGILGEQNKLTPLGKYLYFSSNFLEDFFKLLVLSDEDFYFTDIVVMLLFVYYHAHYFS